MTRAEELANAHWKYIEGILNVHCVEDNMIVAFRYHYVTAFVHGYKHAMEEMEESRRVFTEIGGLGDK